MFSRPSRTVSRNTLRLPVETVEAGAIQRAESQGCMAIHPKPAREIESDSDTPCDRCCGIAGSNGRSSFSPPGSLAARDCCTMRSPGISKSDLHTSWKPCFSSSWVRLLERTPAHLLPGLLFLARFGETY